MGVLLTILLKKDKVVGTENGDEAMRSRFQAEHIVPQSAYLFYFLTGICFFYFYILNLSRFGKASGLVNKFAKKKI